ncbi:MAG: PAS domain-containing protein [Bacteroidota bacterium]
MKVLDHSLFKTLTSHLPYGVTIFKLISPEEMDFEYIYANDKISSMMGVDFQHFIGKSLRTVSPEAYKGEAPFPHSLLHAFTGGKSTDALGTISTSTFGRKRYTATFIPLDNEHVSVLTYKVQESESIIAEHPIQHQLIQQGKKVVDMCSWIVDEHTGETYFTDTYLAVHHFHPNEVQAATAANIRISRIHPDDQERMAIFRKTPSDQFPISATYRYQIGEDTYIWLQDTLSQRLADGKLIGITQDISSKMEKELQLIEALTFREKIIETSPDIIYLYDVQEHQYVFTNRANVELLGYTAEEIQTMGDQLLQKIMHPDDLPKIYRDFTETLPAMEEGELNKRRFRLLHNQTGEHIWYEAQEAVFDRSITGEVKTIIGISRNVNEEVKRELKLKLLHKELTSAHNFQEKILSTSADSIYVYDIQKRENIYSNKAITEMLGYSQDEIKAMGNQFLPNAIHEEDIELVKTHHSQTLPNLGDEEIVSLQYRIWKKARNKYIWLESLEAVFERTKDGKVKSVLGIGRDISPKKLAQTKLKETNEELEQLVYSVSHDLRAPIRHIEGHATHLEEIDNLLLSEEGSMLLERIIYSSRRMGSMIDELLTYSRTRNIIPKKEWVQVDTLIQQLRDAFNLNTATVPIKWDISPLPTVFVDPAMIQKVFEVLIDNAIKFSTPKGKAYIGISTEENTREITFKLEDQGVGFNMKYYHKLFAIFQSLHKRSQFQGNGIGLANVERIIHHHDGKIWAESQVNKGTIFFFSIPIPL